MKNTSIVFTEPRVAALVEEELPSLAPGLVLVRSVRDSVSAGTERANLIGDPNVSIHEDGPAVFPRRIGYSIAGVVEAVGEGVTSVAVGDAVACSWTQHGLYNLLPEKQVYKLDGVGFDAGALVHIATFPLAAIRKCRLEIGESAAVMGLGVLGLISVALLRAAGATPIVACDPIPEKRALALRYGADVALDPLAPDFAEQMKAATGGGAHVAIEVTGRGEALESVLDGMARFGRVALLGCTRDRNFTIDYYRKVHGPGITLVGAHTLARPENDSSHSLWTERDDALAVLRLVRGGRLPLGSFVEEVHDPKDAPALFARLASEPTFPIVQFDWTHFA